MARKKPATLGDHIHYGLARLWETYAEWFDI